MYSIFSTRDIVHIRGYAMSFQSEGPGVVTPCQIKNHMQWKFATPILYAIDIIKIYDFFSIYITIDNIFCMFF